MISVLECGGKYLITCSLTFSKKKKALICDICQISMIYILPPWLISGYQWNVIEMWRWEEITHSRLFQASISQFSHSSAHVLNYIRSQEWLGEKHHKLNKPDKECNLFFQATSFKVRELKELTVQFMNFKHIL